MLGLNLVFPPRFSDFDHASGAEFDMTTSVWRRAASLAAATISLVGLAACGDDDAPASADSTSQAPVIRVGATLSLTGDFAPDSKLVRDGYQFWYEQVQAAGGITVGDTTYQLELITQDDGSNREQGVQNVEQFITIDEVDFVLAPWGSGNTAAVAPVTERYEKVTIAPLAMADSLWEQGHGHLYGVLPLASDGMRPVVRLAESLGATSVAVVGTDDLNNTLSAQGAVDEATALGLDVRLHETYPEGQIDLAALISKLKNADADLVIAVAHTSDAELLLRQFEEQRYFPRALSLTGAVIVPEFLESTEYVFGQTFWSPDLPVQDPLFGTAGEFATAFEERFGYRPTHDSVASATAGYLLQYAIEQAGTLDSAAVNAVLQTLGIETVLGPVSFTADTHTNVGGGSYVVQIQDGVPTIVYPADLSRAAPIYPAPGWDQR
ncbi:MAG TPA: amino acid ABC transporter substrate-binding protein [Ilumatobacteraceae bacterium]|nr:amino acid ABC transporter substrate-binding protein [Ilumatobacteraceae bacterium]